MSCIWGIIWIWLNKFSLLVEKYRYSCMLCISHYKYPGKENWTFPVYLSVWERFFLKLPVCLLLQSNQLLQLREISIVVQLILFYHSLQLWVTISYYHYLSHLRRKGFLIDTRQANLQSWKGMSTSHVVINMILFCNPRAYVQYFFTYNPLFVSTTSVPLKISVYES